MPESFEFNTGQVSGLTDRIFAGLGARFYSGQLVRYDAAATAIGGLTDGAHYYVSVAADGQSLTLSLTEDGAAINLSTSGPLTNTHTLTGVETFTVDADDDIFLDVQALLRQDIVGGYVVNIDRIAAGDDADVLLRPSLVQEGEGTSGGVRVKYTSGQDDVFHTFFDTPLNQDPVGVSRGVYATGDDEIASTYDFRRINPSNGLRQLAGLVSGLDTTGGDVKVVAAESAPSDTRINVLGITEVTRTGDNCGRGSHHRPDERLGGADREDRRHAGRQHNLDRRRRRALLAAADPRCRPRRQRRIRRRRAQHHHDLRLELREPRRRRHRRTDGRGRGSDARLRRAGAGRHRNSR